MKTDTPQNTTPAQAASSPSRSSFIIFLLFVGILASFSSLVNDMYLPTMPAMMRQFHTTASMTQLGLSMAMLGMGIGSAVWGSLSDHYGRKPMLIWSLALFVGSTVAAIFSPGIHFFVVMRLLQGIGAGGAMVLSYSIPADLYQGRRLATIMAIVGAINGIAPAASPVIGGFMADATGWRGIFVLLLVIGVVMFLWSLRRPESLAPAKRIQGKGLGGYAKAYGALFRNYRFMVYVLIKAIAIGVLYVYISSAPFIIQDHYGFSPAHFGLILGANALAIAVGSTLVMRFRVLKRGLVVGTIIMSAFAIGEAVVLMPGGNIALFEVMAVPMLLGCGMVFSAANSLAMEVGRADAGTASAILNVVKYVFAAIVSPLVGLGNIMHSTAYGYIAVAVLSFVLAFMAYRLAPLAEMVKNGK